MGFIQAPSVPVSWGELLDKMTILQIKQKRILVPTARDNIGREYELLSAAGEQALRIEAIKKLVASLKQVNEALWEIEDAIRQEERMAQFGASFIELARSVYRMNDRRSAIKRDINALLESELVEEKSYAAGGD